MRCFAVAAWLALALAGCLDPTPTPLEAQWTVSNQGDEAISYQITLEGRDTAEASGQLQPGQQANHTLRAIGQEITATIEGQDDTETVTVRTQCNDQVLESTWNGTWSLDVAQVEDCPV